MRPKTHNPMSHGAVLTLEPSAAPPNIPSLEALRREAGLPPQPPAEPGPARRAWFAADLEVQRRRNAMERQAHRVGGRP